MKKAIQNYYERLKNYPDYYKNEDFSKVSSQIRNNFNEGIMLVERTDKTDLSLFEKEFGYKLPTEIADYINLFWHPHISGYAKTQESIVLFSVLKKEDNTINDILFDENSFITMAREWAEMGDVQKFIPIGWLGYSGRYVLYEVSSNNIFIEDMDDEGEVEKEPIADSLRELIEKMDVTKY